MNYATRVDNCCTWAHGTFARIVLFVRGLLNLALQIKNLTTATTINRRTLATATNRSRILLIQATTKSLTAMKNQATDIPSQATTTNHRATSLTLHTECFSAHIAGSTTELVKEFLTPDALSTFNLVILFIVASIDTGLWKTLLVFWSETSYIPWKSVQFCTFLKCGDEQFVIFTSASYVPWTQFTKGHLSTAVF